MGRDGIRDMVEIGTGETTGILLKSLNWPHPAKNFKRAKTFDKRGKTFDNSKFNFRSIM